MLTDGIDLYIAYAHHCTRRRRHIAEAALKKKGEHIYCPVRSEVNMHCHVISAKAIYVYARGTHLLGFMTTAEWLQVSNGHQRTTRHWRARPASPADLLPYCNFPSANCKSPLPRIFGSKSMLCRCWSRPPGIPVLNVKNSPLRLV